MERFDIEAYATVQERISEFYREFPTGTIQTRLALREGTEVIFEARIYRSPEDYAARLYTNGWAREVEGGGPGVNRHCHLENAETSAIGRALSNLGYASVRQRPSRSEMLKAHRMEVEHEAMLNFIRTTGPSLPQDRQAEIQGQRVNLRNFTKSNWPTIKGRYRLAQEVVHAFEEATGRRFQSAP